MLVIATDAIQAKLSVLGITLTDIEEALFLLESGPIVDRRPQHCTTPPTVWFVAPTFDDRVLFVAGIYDAANAIFITKTAREANETDLTRWHNGNW